MSDHQLTENRSLISNMAPPTTTTNKVKSIWDEWNLRGLVLVSLFFQIFLIVIAPWRKRTRNRIVILLIWGAYLLADWVAAFAVGHISSGQVKNCNKYHVDKHLAAFWAPFLLLHLGGPDTITAFSLEDNELWLRHALGFLIQLVAVVYVFSESVPNQFWILTVLMIFAGTIKYVERTRALYLASSENFKNSILLNNARITEEIKGSSASPLPVAIERLKELDEESTTSEYLNEIQVVKKGYKFFQIIKKLIIYQVSRSHERDECRKFFIKRNYKDIFRVMEVELNFMYDVFYTKMVVVHCKSGYSLRLICSILIVVSFALFASHHHKHQLDHLDIVVTYTLLIGAVGLDLVSLVKLIFSDWTIALLDNSKAKRTISAIKGRVSFDKRCQPSNSISSVSQYSLINYCVNQRSKWFDKVVKSFGLKDFVDEIQYIRTSHLNDNLKDFIFVELKEKALKAEKDKKFAKEISSAKGNWVLSLYKSCHPSIVHSVSSGVDYDHSLLMWHLATEICYYKGAYSDEVNVSQNREFCKILSDYLVYLIVMKPTMMSIVEGIAQVRIRHTCEKAKKVLKSRLKPLNMYENFKKFFQTRQSELMMERLVACQILGVESNVTEVGSQSVLVEACNLATQLNELESERRWEIMSRVWVEMLSYAAIHCGPHAHAQQLSKGGELITFIWLLMSHFGMGKHLPVLTEIQQI